MEHVLDDLPALLTGELTRDQARSAVDHLRSCDVCRQSLVGAAATGGALRLSARTWDGVAVTGPSPSGSSADVLPALHRPRVRLPRRLGVAAAALVLLAGGGAAALATRDSGGDAPGARVAALSSTSGGTARGVVRMRQPGSRTDITVSTTGLTPPGRDQFYEVWLFDPVTSKMVGIGVLAPDGAGSFRVPAALITAYRAVDVSLQRDNGDPRHSASSVLRGRYS